VARAASHGPHHDAPRAHGLVNGTTGALSACRPGGPQAASTPWIPAFAGMTRVCRGYFSAARASGTVSAGDTLYQAPATLPFSSIRNDERMMPKYFLPYIDFSPHTP